MARGKYILAIDQGTTSSKAVVLSPDGGLVGVSKGFPVRGVYPQPGWVEYDPGQMFESVCAAARHAVQEAALGFEDIAAIGLDNQGETSAGTDRRRLVRSVVDAIAFRVRDIYDAMDRAGVRPDSLRVDGGLTQSRVLMQSQSDLLGIDLHVSDNPQVTAIGVGLMAGLGAGIWSWPDGLPEAPPRRDCYQPDPTCAERLESRYRTFKRLCREVAQWEHLGHSKAPQP